MSSELVSSKLEKKDWIDWFNKMKKISSLTNSFLEMFPNENVQSNDFKTIWQKTNLIKYFIENLCIKSDNDKIYSRCVTLWNLFKGAIDFKKYECFEKLMKTLKLIINGTKKTTFEQNKPCEGCTSIEYDELYAKNDCKICSKCKIEYQSTKKCPACNKTSKTLAQIEKFSNFSCLTKYNQFKLNLNNFIMDIILNICFKDSELPDSQVVDLIIDYLLPKPNDLDEKSILFNFDLDKSPSIKSNLFQLLLNHRQENVESHLNNIFSKSARFLRDNYKIDDLSNLKLMYLNSFEDNLYLKSSLDSSTSNNLSLDICEGTKILNEIFDSLNTIDNLDTINQLKLIAKIKFCLVTCAKLINVFNQNDTNHENYLHLISNFVQQNNNCLWLRFFLIKQIFRRFGKQDLVELMKNNRFEWITQNVLSNQSKDEVNYYSFIKIFIYLIHFN